MPFFFFNDTATTEIYTLSLHDALPILYALAAFRAAPVDVMRDGAGAHEAHRAHLRVSQQRVHGRLDRKSTRLNSSHLVISYAVFCLKKKIYKKLCSAIRKHLHVSRAVS